MTTVDAPVRLPAAATDAHAHVMTGPVGAVPGAAYTPFAALQPLGGQPSGSGAPGVER